MEEPELPPEHVSPIELAPCQTCGRNFNPDVLARHQNICIKKKGNRRTPFDTAKHRVKGTDLEAFLYQKKYIDTPEDQRKKIAYEKQALKKKQWKRKHEDFVSTIRTAREYDAAVKTGHNIPPPGPSAPNPDYVQCPYCKRRFQEHAAERHIPFCKEQNSRIERTINNNSIINKRPKYKPPALRKRSGTGGGGVDPHNPPGASLIRKKTNFSATYTVNENGDRDYRQSPDCEQRFVSGSGSRKSSSQVEGTASQNLPGSIPRVRKPYPPSKLAPPGVHSRMIHIKRPENVSQQENTTSRGEERGYPNHNKYHDDDEADHSHHQPINSSRAQPLRSREHGGDKNSGRRFSSLENNSDQSPIEEQRKLSALGNRKSSLQSRDYSESSHSDTSIEHTNGYFSSTQANTKPNISARGRISSNTSVEAQKNSHLNIHGMTMSKFCYECGCKFPVPQAKYCCECGTKRI